MEDELVNKADGLWGRRLILDVCSRPWGDQDSIQEPWRGHGWGLGVENSGLAGLLLKGVLRTESLLFSSMSKLWRASPARDLGPASLQDTKSEFRILKGRIYTTKMAALIIVFRAGKRMKCHALPGNPVFSGLPWVAQRVKNLLATRETQVQSLGWEDSLEKGMATHSVFMPGDFHGQRSLAGYSPWGHKELDTTE